MNNVELDRLEGEKEHYNKVFRLRRSGDASIIVDGKWFNKYYRNHGFSLQLLGDIKNKKILNIGCGGFAGGGNHVWLVKKGATVIGIDITEEGLNVTRDIADYNNVSVDLRLEGAEKMSFPDDYFDKIFSYGVIHHLNIEDGIRELSRCLKKRGELVIMEPWDGNPILRFSRKYLWYPKKDRTNLEKPLTSSDIVLFSKYFQKQELFYFNLFGAFIRFLVMIPFERVKDFLISICHRVDDFFLGRFPFMKRYCGIVVGKFTK